MNLITNKISFCLLSGAAALCTANLASAESVYRVEQNGTVTYQDRAPASDSDNGHTVLSNQGLVVQQVLSRDERRIARKKAEIMRLAKIRDRALLATFTTENDLLRTRDDRIGMIDGLISRLDDRIRILSERLQVVESRIGKLEASKGLGMAHKSMYAEQASIQRNIENAWTLIDTKAVERRSLSEKFDDDITRYRELKAERS